MFILFKIIHKSIYCDHLLYDVVQLIICQKLWFVGAHILLIMHHLLYLCLQLLLSMCIPVIIQRYVLVKLNC